ncbi:unnamed protein product [Symbiodinium microadriaticum]|nr:unnamed protein product [Symbiodinium microadriaticum]
MVRFVRPGLLRTTSLSRTFSVLLELCRAESSAETAQAFLQSTESADRVGAFISHSWHAKPLPKVLALCYELNVSMAVKACWLTWLAVSLLLLASAGGTSEDTRDILGSIETSPWVFFFTVDLPLIVFVMFFFFAHGLTFEFWTPSVWFDKACINQEDQDEKEEAIAILPEILQQSSRILVVWDPTLFSRLWCNLEIATFAKSHREDPDAIRILQPWITPWLLCSLFAEWLAARVLLPWYGQLLTTEENLEWHPGSFMDYLVAGLISNAPFVVLQLPALWISAVFFSYKLRCSADILDAFANFDVRIAQCSMSSDRGALHAQIARVFDEIEDAPLSIEVEVSENFPRSPPKADPVDPELVELIRRPSVRRITSYPSEEMCLDLFNTFVRNELRCQIVEETGRPSHLPLGLAILGALPLQLWLISDIYLQCEQAGCKTVPMFYYLNSTDQYWVFVSVSTFYDAVLAKPLLYTAALHTLDRVYSIGASCALEWLLIIPAMALVQLCCYFFEALVTGCMEYLLAEGDLAWQLESLSAADGRMVGSLFRSLMSSDVDSGTGWRADAMPGTSFLGLLEDEVGLRVAAAAGAKSCQALAQVSKAAARSLGDEAAWRAFCVGLLQERHGSEEDPLLASFAGSWAGTALSLLGSSGGPVPPSRRSTKTCPLAMLRDVAAKLQNGRFAEMVARRPAAELTTADFRRLFEALPGTPVVLEGAAGLASPQGETAWQLANLGPALAARPCRCHLQDDALALTSGRTKLSVIRLPFDEYLKYMDAQEDAEPLYLFQEFDSDIREAVDKDFRAPNIFAEDFLLDATEPPEGFVGLDGWLLVGPERSGSRWHFDPWGTAAWNLLFEGEKLWAMAPPTGAPPQVEAQMLESSLSGETVRRYYSAPPAMAGLLMSLPGSPAAEKLLWAVQRPGDLVFIPSGWWHCTVSLSKTTAYTRNYINSHNYQRVQGSLSSLHPSMAAQLKQWRPGSEIWFRGGELEVAI